MLIFDFDCVFMNSIHEITVTTFNSVTGRLVTSLEDIPQGIVRSFERNRYHVQAIGDTLSLMHWCVESGRQEPNRFLTQADYAQILKRETVPLLNRINTFFATRKSFVEKDEACWLSLNEPYQPLWNALKKYPNERVFLLTNKNREAAWRLCHHFDLKPPKENIYPGDKGVAKIENLRMIHERFNRSPYDFIDDSIKNLKELDAYFNTTNGFIRLILALWGYVGPEDEKTAKASGYSSFQQKAFLPYLHQQMQV